MHIPKESYIKRKTIKRLSYDFPNDILRKAYNFYLKDFKDKKIKGIHFSYYGFKRFAFNRDLFINAIFFKQKINKILNNIKIIEHSKIAKRNQKILNEI